MFPKISKTSTCKNHFVLLLNMCTNIDKSDNRLGLYFSIDVVVMINRG